MTDNTKVNNFSACHLQKNRMKRQKMQRNIYLVKLVGEKQQISLKVSLDLKLYILMSQGDYSPSLCQKNAWILSYRQVYLSIFVQVFLEGTLSYREKTRIQDTKDCRNSGRASKKGMWKIKNYVVYDA